MVKCKFCNECAMMNIKVYGYRKFSVCKNCLGWVLIELKNFEKRKL
jgi:hypothetical protein